MYVNITSGKMDPSNVATAIKFLDRDEVRNAFRAVKGFRHDYVINSLETPSALQSVTIWEDAEEAQAFFASPAYRQILGGLLSLFTERPQRFSFEVLLDF